MTDQALAADYSRLVAGQRAYFKAGHTRPVEWRIEQLKAIKTMIDESRDAMYEALWHDLRRNRTDADLMDVDYQHPRGGLRADHLHELDEAEHVPTPSLMEPGHVRVRRDPLGVTLIIGAWNEPYMLTLAPLVAAIAAGNTAVLKPSEIAEASAAQTAEMVPKYLDREAIAVIEGGVPETTALLAQKWDLIFFTGSPPVGKIVHQAAAQNLTPAVLELGGKNPTIVHSSANLKTAARRIAFGRYANSGHICTAPDHVLVWPEVKDELVAELQEAIRDFYGDDPEAEPRLRPGHQPHELRPPRRIDLGQWHDRRRAARPTRTSCTSRRPCSSTSRRLADHAGGGVRPDPAGARDRLGRGGDRLGQRAPAPLGPVRLRRGRGRRRADPRARQTPATRASTTAPSTRWCRELPFGGVGNSGMGKYHGRWGFEAFTNARGVLYHSALIDPDVKYPPYAEHTREREVMEKLL